ncbi:amino acid ABC transporter substrate-binding protein [Philodulcilactobacillus myokoensis]|uniref:Amino acid ABC transporter substrate-binding protein n=1 Tax=Philodulcilactobacillus myokoensis TaxID=2929573 RepID=A0A9W6ERW6_9LACO|nr:transporter substrate-binding domain-containing protein [Philodulcilactobacillus myokoensis]GLB46310.1 amino acid ABC transporter substrate-binding protein [Philodulcilactobacillus myokoensis]
MSKKGYIYTGIIAAIIIIIGVFHFTSSKTQKATKSHPQTVNVAVDTSNRPYSFVDGNNVSGYDGELLKKLDQELPQYKFKYYNAAQNSVFVGLESGKYDLASSGFWYSKQRAQQYLLSNPSGIADLRLVYRQNEGKVNGFQDVVKKHLNLAPISSDDARYNVIQQYNNSHPKEKIKLKAIGDQSAGDALKQLQQKQFDAVFYPYQAFVPVQQAGGAKGLTVSPSLGFKNDYIAANKNPKNKQLISDINKELKKLKANGYLEKLSKKWLGENVFNLPGAEKNFENPKG